MGSCAFDKHYRVKELAKLWGLSTKTVQRIFGKETGVIRVANEGTGKRRYATLSIPESVALRVHDRLGHPSTDQPSAGNHTPHVIRLSDIDSGVSRQQTVIKLKSRQHAHG
jgi:AraC-like DNA-binding protein